MPNKSTKTSALIVTGVTTFIAPFMISGVNIVLPGIQKTFSASAVMLSWVASSYILSTAVFLIPMGKIADIYGRKKIYSTGIIIFIVSNFLCAFPWSIEILIALRVIQGIGGAMLVSTGMAIITSVFPVEERGRAIGINVASTYLGLSAGPFIGGLLSYYFDWRSIFIFITPLGIISILLSIFYLKGEWADARGEKFDVIGSLIYAVSLVMIMYGVSILPKIDAFVWYLFRRGWRPCLPTRRLEQVANVAFLPGHRGLLAGHARHPLGLRLPHRRGGGDRRRATA